MWRAISALLIAAFLSGCEPPDEEDEGCVPDYNRPCNLMFAPVCVQTAAGTNCYEGNDCPAQARCELILCGLDLDETGNIDPASSCAQAHPGCLDPCP
jgi:hypothetical protein